MADLLVADPSMNPPIALRSAAHADPHAGAMPLTITATLPMPMPMAMSMPIPIPIPIP